MLDPHSEKKIPSPVSCLTAPFMRVMRRIVRLKRNTFGFGKCKNFKEAKEINDFLEPEDESLGPSNDVEVLWV